VPDPQQIEQRGGHSKRRKADEHNRDHGVPDESHVASERCNHVFAVDHRLTLL
jgi:hypothetical protein